MSSHAVYSESFFRTQIIILPSFLPFFKKERMFLQNKLINCYFSHPRQLLVKMLKLKKCYTQETGWNSENVDILSVMQSFSARFCPDVMSEGKSLDSSWHIHFNLCIYTLEKGAYISFENYLNDIAARRVTEHWNIPMSLQMKFCTTLPARE